MQKNIDHQAILNAAKIIGCLPAAILAVDEVESGGSGFLRDGKLKILFEPHIFWKQLKKKGIDPAPLAKKWPGLLNPIWDKKLYKIGGTSWQKMAIAKTINEHAALNSASYGRYQIMGFNAEAAGYADVKTMVELYESGEAEQLQSFCHYIKNVQLDDELRALAWASFARGYNGASYWKNQYDTKLKTAFLKFQKIA